MRRVLWVLAFCSVALAACSQGGDASSSDGVPAAAPSEAVVAPAAAEETAAPGDAATPPTEVVLWHAYRGLEKQALEEAVAGWHGVQQRVRIRVQAVPYDPFVDKIGITVPRGQGPDLFIFAHNMIGSWVDKEIIEPLGERVPAEALRGFSPKSVRALVYQQSLYGLPLALKTLVLYHRTDLLPSVPSSMEALIDVLKQVQKDRRGVAGLAYEAGLLYFHAPWMHAFGASVFGPDGSPGLDSGEQVRALRFAEALRKTHGVLPEGMSGAMVTKLFNDGKVAAAINGPWFRAEIADDVPYAVSRIPTVAGAEARPFLTVEAVFISRASEKIPAAVEAAMFLAGEVSAQTRMTVGMQPVAHLGTLERAKDPAMATFRAQAEKAVVMSAAPEMQLVWPPADSAIGGTVFGDREPQAALERAQAKIVSEMARRRAE